MSAWPLALAAVPVALLTCRALDVGGLEARAAWLVVVVLVVGALASGALDRGHQIDGERKTRGGRGPSA